MWSDVDLGGRFRRSHPTQPLFRRRLLISTLVSQPAQEMPFPDATFDVILSNLCLHNIYDGPTRRKALHQIVRVLKPGGIALIFDYKRTGEYAEEFGRRTYRRKEARKPYQTFPPLTVVVVRKPM